MNSKTLGTHAGNVTISLAVAFAAILGAGQAKASIVWSTPTTIAATSDVLSSGTVVDAYDFGTTGLLGSTVNGVSFSPFITNGSATTVGNVTLSDSGGVNNAFGSASAPFSNLPAAYQTILASSSYTLAGGLTVTLGGLSSGQSYEAKFWVNDSRNGIGTARQETITDSGVVSGTLLFDTGTEGGLGQFVVGTFTASGPTEQFLILGSVVSQINAFEVVQTSTSSAAPEPSSIVLFGSAALFVGLAARYRHLWRS